VTKPPPPTVQVTSGANQSLQTGSSAPTATLALSGAKELTLSVSSSNAALLPTAAASLSNGCGTSSMTCILSMKPVAGQSGQATLTITAVDAYGQSSHGTLALSVTPASGGGGGGGGGAFDYGSLLILGMWLAGSRGAAGGTTRRRAMH